jgi:hypothetical protein
MGLKMEILNEQGKEGAIGEEKSFLRGRLPMDRHPISREGKFYGLVGFIINEKRPVHRGAA